MRAGEKLSSAILGGLMGNLSWSGYRARCGARNVYWRLWHGRPLTLPESPLSGTACFSLVSFIPKNRARTPARHDLAEKTCDKPLYLFSDF